MPPLTKEAQELAYQFTNMREAARALRALAVAPEPLNVPQLRVLLAEIADVTERTAELFERFMQQVEEALKQC